MAETYRTLTYKVRKDGGALYEGKSTAPQCGGVQGEHNAVQLVFEISTSDIDLEAATGHHVAVRIECRDGAGGFHASENLTLDDSTSGIAKASYFIPQSVTNAGGVAQFHLVIVDFTLDNDDNAIAEFIRYSFPVRIYFKDSTNSAVNKNLYAEDISSMADSVRRLTIRAETAADKADSGAANAMIYKTQAQEAADSASESATQAEESAAAALSSAGSAGGYASAAATSATYAAKQATNAENAATQAENSKNAAEGYATGAAGSASAAAGSASAANTSAQTASSAASSAAGSASAAAQSAEDAQQAAEANRFIHDVNIQYSGSAITSATYKYGTETMDITEELSTVPFDTINAGIYYIRDSGAIATDYSDTDCIYIAKIDVGGSPQVIQSLEYLPIDQKTAVPAYEKLRSQIDEITTATREITNAAYFDDLSSANPGMSISGLAQDDTVYVFGRNLAPKIPTQEKNGLTLTQNADGSVTINGTATGDSSTTFSVSGNVTLPKGAKFTFSGCTAGSNSTYRMYVYQPGWQQCFIVGGGVNRPVSNFAVTTKPVMVKMTETLLVTITILVPAGQTLDNVTFYPMCELGETTRGYVPYIEAESYTANSNGHVSCVPPQPEATVITGKTCTVEYNQNTQIAAANAERRINQTATNALIGTKTGTVVRIDDISPLPHNPQVEITGATADGTNVVNPVVKAYGKNLLDLDTYQMETQTINGVTITNYGNGYFELTGTPTEAQTVQLYSSQFYASDGLNIYPPGTYTASEGITVTLRKAADNSGIGNKSGTFTVDEAFYISQWYVFVTSAGVVGGTNGKTTPFGFRPQLEAGDTATDYEAYKEPQSYSYTGTLGTNNRFTLPDGTFDSVYPTMTMTVTNDNSGTVEGSLTVQYNRDINAAFNELAAAIAAQA